MLFDRIYSPFSSGSAPSFTEEPNPQPFLATEGKNVTLEWRYNFGGGSFRQLFFETTRVTIVDKLAAEKVANIASAYGGRLLANVTDTYTSITFLGINRSDSAAYTLEITGKNRGTVGRAHSEVDILVQCKYKKTN